MQTKLSTLQKAMGDGFDRVLKLKAIKRSSGGIPIEPRIMRTSHTVKVNQEVSVDSIPKGVLNEWQKGYQAANPAIAREILCVSKSVRWHKSWKKVAKLAVVPEDFYEVSLESLLMRGNHL